MILIIFKSLIVLSCTEEMIVKIHNSAEAKDEYCMLEFQAKLSELGVHLGDIELRGKKAILTTESHVWEGSIQDLERSFVVLEKIANEDSMEEENSTSDINNNVNEKKNNKMVVTGIVKKRILFSNRPKPIRKKK